jgi:hypothetical protein
MTTRSQRHQLGLLRNGCPWVVDDKSSVLTINYIRFNVNKYLFPANHSLEYIQNIRSACVCSFLCQCFVVTARNKLESGVKLFF